jgi:phosphatidate phosphatase PAH1
MFYEYYILVAYFEMLGEEFPHFLTTGLGIDFFAGFRNEITDVIITDAAIHQPYQSIRVRPSGQILICI